MCSAIYTVAAGDEGKASAQEVRTNAHTGVVYSVCWSTVHNVVASGGADNACKLWVPPADPKAAMRCTFAIAHPGAVNCCDFSGPAAQGKCAEGDLILATACDDSIIRIYSVALDGCSARQLQQLAGHTAKAFNAIWSPLLPYTLASSSNDRTIAVWDLSNGLQVKAATTWLHGHLDNTRAVAWNAHVPYILFTGSWDGCIRVWDIRGAGCCLRVVLDHHADVYDVCSHATRPFLMASSSRDTTLRLWSCDLLTPGLHLALLEGTEATAQVDETMVPGAPARLCSPVTMQAVERMGACKTSAERVALRADLCIYADGIQELGDALAQVCCAVLCCAV